MSELKNNTAACDYGIWFKKSANGACTRPIALVSDEELEIDLSRNFHQGASKILHQTLREVIEKHRESLKPTHSSITRPILAPQQLIFQQTLEQIILLAESAIVVSEQQGKEKDEAKGASVESRGVVHDFVSICRIFAEWEEAIRATPLGSSPHGDPQTDEFLLSCVDYIHDSVGAIAGDHTQFLLQSAQKRFGRWAQFYVPLNPNIPSQDGSNAKLDELQSSDITTLNAAMGWLVLHFIDDDDEEDEDEDEENQLDFESDFFAGDVAKVEGEEFKDRTGQQSSASEEKDTGCFNIDNLFFVMQMLTLPVMRKALESNSDVSTPIAVLPFPYSVYSNELIKSIPLVRRVALGEDDEKTTLGPETDGLYKAFEAVLEFDDSHRKSNQLVGTFKATQTAQLLLTQVQLQTAPKVSFALWPLVANCLAGRSIPEAAFGRFGVSSAIAAYLASAGHAALRSITRIPTLKAELNLGLNEKPNWLSNIRSPISPLLPPVYSEPNPKSGTKGGKSASNNSPSIRQRLEASPERLVSATFEDTLILLLSTTRCLSMAHPNSNPAEAASRANDEAKRFLSMSQSLLSLSTTGASDLAATGLIATAFGILRVCSLIKATVLESASEMLPVAVMQLEEAAEHALSSSSALRQSTLGAAASVATSIRRVGELSVLSDYFSDAYGERYQSLLPPHYILKKSSPSNDDEAKGDKFTSDWVSDASFTLALKCARVCFPSLPAQYNFASKIIELLIQRLFREHIQIHLTVKVDSTLGKNDSNAVLIPVTKSVTLLEVLIKEFSKLNEGRILLSDERLVTRLTDVLRSCSLLAAHGEKETFLAPTINALMKFDSAKVTHFGQAIKILQDRAPITKGDDPEAASNPEDSVATTVDQLFTDLSPVSDESAAAIDKLTEQSDIRTLELSTRVSRRGDIVDAFVDQCNVLCLESPSEYFPKFNSLDDIVSLELPSFEADGLKIRELSLYDVYRKTLLSKLVREGVPSESAKVFGSLLHSKTHANDIDLVIELSRSQSDDEMWLLLFVSELRDAITTGLYPSESEAGNLILHALERAHTRSSKTEARSGQNITWKAVSEKALVEPKRLQSRRHNDFSSIVLSSWECPIDMILLQKGSFKFVDLYLQQGSAQSVPKATWLVPVIAIRQGSSLNDTNKNIEYGYMADLLPCASLLLSSRADAHTKSLTNESLEFWYDALQGLSVKLKRFLETGYSPDDAVLFCDNKEKCLTWVNALTLQSNDLDEEENAAKDALQSLLVNKPVNLDASIVKSISLKLKKSIFGDESQ